MGRYGKGDRMIYREEELSRTPWARAMPPGYDSSFASSSKVISKRRERYLGT